ncbi:MAG: hypothetical protein V3W37_03020 [Candidatus Binatia bacterium]
MKELEMENGKLHNRLNDKSKELGDANRFIAAAKDALEKTHTKIRSVSGTNMPNDEAECAELQRQIVCLLSDTPPLPDLEAGRELSGLEKDTVFIAHIMAHLEKDQCVICKICGKSAMEIMDEWPEILDIGAER